MGTGQDRNKLCSCGSGKKYKRCCFGKRKDRMIRVGIDPQNIGLMDGLGLSSKGRVFRIVNGVELPLIGDLSIEYGYKRERKYKVLAKGPLPTANSYLNPNMSLLEFDSVFALDTNSKTIDQDKVSVAALLHFKIETTNNSAAMIGHAFIGWFEYWNIKEKEENIVWMEIARAINEQSEYQKQKVALLVDSDLGNHELFNKRELPIFDNYYLPSNFTLIYASADSGKETLINRAITFCDKKASELMQYIASKDVGINIKDAKVEGRPFTHFRQWYPDKEFESNHIDLSGLSDVEAYAEDFVA